MSKLTEIMMAVSDGGNVAISKGIHYFGVTSLVGGATTSIAQKAGIAHSDPSWTLSDWGIMMSIVGALTLILKNLADIWFNWRRHKREDAASKGGE